MSLDIFQTIGAGQTKTITLRSNTEVVIDRLSVRDYTFRNFDVLCRGKKVIPQDKWSIAKGSYSGADTPYLKFDRRIVSQTKPISITIRNINKYYDAIFEGWFCEHKEYDNQEHNIDNPKYQTELQRLAQAMAQPIRRSLDYQGIARRALNVELLPQGALLTYDRDIDISAAVLQPIKKRRFNVIDRAVQKARNEITQAEDAQVFKMMNGYRLDGNVKESEEK